MSDELINRFFRSTSLTLFDREHAQAGKFFTRLVGHVVVSTLLTLAMRHRDLEIALQHLNVIRELFAEHGAGSNGLAADVVGAIELLTGSLSRVATDCLFQ